MTAEPAAVHEFRSAERSRNPGNPAHLDHIVRPPTLGRVARTARTVRKSVAQHQVTGSGIKAQFTEWMLGSRADPLGGRGQDLIGRVETVEPLQACEETIPAAAAH